MDLWSYLKGRAHHYEGLPALAKPDGSWLTYGELVQTVEWNAKRLQVLSEPKGRVLIVHTHPYYDAIGILSVLASGHVAVPLSLQYGTAKCNLIMEDSEASAILTDIEEIPVQPWNRQLLQSIRTCSLNQEFTGESMAKLEIAVQDPAFILYTSGTGGVPKGVLLSHSNIISNLDGISHYFTVYSEDHILIVRPLCHASAITGELLYGLSQGAKISFYDGPFSPFRLISCLKTAQPTVLCTTPTIVYQMMNTNRKHFSEKLSKLVISGECLHESMLDKLPDCFGPIEFYNVYGLTEAAPRVSYLKGEYFLKKKGSVGIPLHNVSIKIVSKDHLEVSCREIGEVLVQGPNVMKGYWKNDTYTHSKMKNQWLHTGDMGYWDEDGFLYIIGRMDDMMIRGGVNISPTEVEEVLLSHPCIDEAMVWGESDPLYGQRICAAVSGNPGITNELVMEICKEKLEPYQWPDAVEIVDSLPKGVTGKVIKKRSVGLELKRS
jgi:long-chain acyl-CoA synthetase